MAGLSNIIKSTIRSATKSAKSTVKSAVRSAAKSELKKGTSSWAKKAHRQIRHEGALAELKAMDRNLISSKTNKKGTLFFEGKGQQEFINRRGNIARKAAEDKLLYDRGKLKIINVAKKSAIPTAITVGGIATLNPSEGETNIKPVTSSGANIPMQVIQQMNYSTNREAGRFSPINQYVKDIIHNATAKEGSPDIVLTNDDFSQSYNEDASRIAQIAYRLYVRNNGYPKPGKIISLPINPSVYKEINTDGKYAKFSMSNIIKAALGGDNQVEFTNGGTSGTAMINPETGNLDITFTDRTAWDDAPSGNRIGNRIRQLMEIIGSSGEDNKGDYIQNLKYSIPRDTIEGNYRGKLRNIPHYYK